GCFLVIALDYAGHGSPWLDGKALAEASPALVAAGVAGASALLLRRRLRLVGIAAAAAIIGGVLWSNVLAYTAVWLAPRTQLAELQTIGNRFAGDGPTLSTEQEAVGVRHFLRNLDPEGASERRARPIYLRSGGTVGKGDYADLDAFQLSSILVYRSIVLRTSPVESRPPSVYKLVWRGRWYEVWQRPAQPTATVLEHLSLG